ncbi:hypothetical protein [Sutcliffiella horikoshii]
MNGLSPLEYRAKTA